jgi:hypothetical protein
VAIQQRALASQLGQYRLPRLPNKFKDVDAAHKWSEDLLRALEQWITVMTGVQATGTQMPLRSNINFLGATVTDDITNDRINVSIGGGGGSGAAPANAEFVVVALNGSLTADRRINPRNGLLSSDLGANNDYVIDVNPFSVSHLIATPGALDWTGTTVKKNGSTTGTRRGIDFVEGSNITLTEVDNGNSTDTVGVTIATGGFAFGANVTQPGAYPYNVLSTDLLVLVDTSAARTINLPASVAKHAVFIKDATGNAGAQPITVTPNGAEKIDQAATYSMSFNRAGIFLAGTGVSGNEWAVVSKF